MNCLISKEHEHGPHHQVFLTDTVNTPFSEQCVSSVFIPIWELLLTCHSNYILECKTAGEEATTISPWELTKASAIWSTSLPLQE